MTLKNPNEAATALKQTRLKIGFPKSQWASWGRAFMSLRRRNTWFVQK